MCLIYYLEKHTHHLIARKKLTMTLLRDYTKKAIAIRFYRKRNAITTLVSQDIVAMEDAMTNIIEEQLREPLTLTQTMWKNELDALTVTVEQYTA